ncbi:snRNA-activating protein complex subunit 1-like [Gadus chalcogrammus]|uniref:snRNA-activating protein complex subunit 1-like n=1 Tax=Gadus chalcogrammus TaxID=1042646 RepID=UPI0024C3175B|nr:snRNA-activating protein complex subunit 1-like [Gadus chalcogrammus]
MIRCKQQVKDDCEELLARFQKTESVRFEVFAKIWREMKFYEIFYGTTERIEGKAFSRHIFTMVCEYLLPPYTFQIRMGALYLLYALYNEQLLRPKVQIQLALKDWEEVKNFEKEAAAAQHFDGVYVLKKLLSQHAFWFAATPHPLTYKLTRKVEKQVVVEDFIERTSRPQELINSELLEELSNVHEHYERYRQSLDQVDGHLVNRDLVPQLGQAVADFSNWQGKMETPVKEEEDSGEGTSQKESSSRALLLASIKSRSFGQAVEASKWRRHRKVEMDVSSNIKERAPRKPTLKSKAATIVIQSDIKKETARHTTLCRLTTPADKPEEVSRKKIEFKW